jgi:hypothetical protein
MHVAVLPNHFDPQGLDAVRRFLPQGDDLVLSELGFLLEEGANFREGFAWLETAFRPPVLQTLNAYLPKQGPAGKSEGVLLANSERVHG